MVTGGTGDLGSVVLPRLARDYRCIVPYRSEQSRHKLDVTNVTPVSDLSSIGDFAPIYGLVLLAGGFASGSSVESFERMVDANLMSAVRAVEAVVPHMANGGRIVAISSAASLARPVGLAAYNSAKAALNAYVETLAKDLKDRAITVNALLPTTLDTDTNRTENSSERTVKRTNVAEMVVLLLSDQAATISGQLIGMTA